MKVFTLGSFAVLLALCATLNTGCYAYHRNGEVGVGVEVHDSRWHYDHDHDDAWRARHPWYGDTRYDDHSYDNR